MNSGAYILCFVPSVHFEQSELTLSCFLSRVMASETLPDSTSQANLIHDKLGVARCNVPYGSEIVSILIADALLSLLELD